MDEIMRVYRTLSHETQCRLTHCWLRWMYHKKQLRAL